MLTFQQVIERLTQFWQKRGCVIHQGHDLEVGAGTFNPATFLRSLGPEPYSTAYVEPSRRPSDGRYAQNPNRVQLFHQFQVIIKPSPADIQKMYLQSLEAIGLDLEKHDIRFVHDDWESPTIGAWGLGWEVWCDGMEVSQFTYFQAVASLPLHPIPVEITYGIERLCMYLQNVSSIFDIQWNDTLTLGDIIKSSEIEWSTYNFEQASTDMWLRHFDDFEREAKRLIALHLPIPAYDFVIKSSHAFNLLDARGVISTTERTGYIVRLRELSRLIAVEYVASREKLGFPLLPPEAPSKPLKVKKVSAKFDATQKRNFFLEIGSEELPATFVPIGSQNLERLVRTFLEKNNLSFDAIRSYGTPRRLAVHVHGLIEGTAPRTIEKRGPPLSIVYDEKGALTVQGEGFLKSVGLKAKDLEVRDKYVIAHVKEKGRSTAQLLAEHLPKLITDIEFPRKMRWGSLDISYARPLRWITCLFGDSVIPFAVGDITSGNYTFGHAQRAPQKIVLKNSSEYLPRLKEHKVLADIDERRRSIEEQLAAIEKETGTQALERERVLDEVVFLTEWPELTLADFSPDFLRAPSEVLISEMVHHQRYFPLAKEGRLQNRFVISADNTPSELIRQGNQKVLSARLTDGVFLYDQDAKIPLETWNGKLREVTFQKDLGSVLDKVMRLVSHVQLLNNTLTIATTSKAERAALLSKADLASSCVKEFPELQGTMGKYFALAQKEDPEVAAALEEQWFPRSEGGALPQTPSGILLSLADKIDNLLGYYSVGLKPSSSSDPYSLRRQTIGLLRILIEKKLSLDLSQLLTNASPLFPRYQSPLLEEILKFITARAKGVFEEYGFKKDEIEASLRKLCTDPYDQFCKVGALSAFRKTPPFVGLFEVYKRAKGQLAKGQAGTFQSYLATEPAEKALVQALEKLEKEWPTVLSGRNYAEAYNLMAHLQQPLAHLFDTVKILADDPQVQANRLALLYKIFTLFEDLLDFSQIQESQ